ncbi:MAG: Glu/Leu/Phe/Val dehydrogenase dimerization domain-containing protein [Chitinophagales bacterium]
MKKLQNGFETLLDKFKNKKAAIVFEWHDTETEAMGWVVINSLRGGAAGGGTRMRKGLHKAEVEALSKIMEIKFTVSGPPIGGAKSGINFDPNDPRREGVLQRWFQAVFPLLKNYYGTGGDLNVDELKDVIPITENLGLWHPQEGVVNGHFNPHKNTKIHFIGQLRQGVSKVVENQIFTPSSSTQKYHIADLMTGYGVAESARHFYDIYERSDVKDKKVIIQGWGNVAGAAAYYLAQEGAKIVGIIDRHHGIIDENGLSFETVKQLFLQRKNNALPSDIVTTQSFKEADAKIWDMPTDIFIPGAASNLVKKEHIERLLVGGLKLVTCGANNPFVDTDLIYGKTQQFVDEHCSLIPDFIANCAMARLFAYLMQENVEITDEAIFADASNTIRDAMFEVFKRSTAKEQITRNALYIALERTMQETYPKVKVTDSDLRAF